jgi:glucose/arabinose dehydrogenase
MMRRAGFLFVLLAVAALGCSGAEPGEDAAVGSNRDLPLDQLRVPPGFRIAVYAGHLPGARSMALGPRGTLFVGTRGEDRVYAVRDTNGDGRADRTWVIAEGLDTPNGVAVRNGDLYVAEMSRVVRYDDIESRLDDPPEPVTVSDAFPTDRSHGWKFIRFGPDGKLYVPIGAPCNVCEPGDPYASITRMNPDGSDWEIFARGVRNTVGFDWDPRTGELWFTDNGRDWLGDNLPPDELNHAPHAGMDFGFPYCYGKEIPDPKYGPRHPCSEFTPAAQELGPHVASVGMRFYTGARFPEEYRGAIFIAEHGSWNRSRPIGYRVTVVRLENGEPVSYDVFARGWLQGSEAWGRPVDVQVMPDGALLVSDDRAGAVYRITWSE